MAITLTKKQKREKKKRLLKVYEIKKKEKLNRHVNHLDASGPVSKELYKTYENFCIQNLMEIGVDKINYPLMLRERIIHIAKYSGLIDFVNPLLDPLIQAAQDRITYINCDSFEPNLLYVADLSLYSFFTNSVGKPFLQYELAAINSIPEPSKRFEELDKLKNRKILSVESMVHIITRAYNQEALNAYDKQVEEHLKTQDEKLESTLESVTEPTLKQE